MGLLQLLADDNNVVILQLLRIEPTYPRRLAALLGKREQKVVPRLKRMEEAGLVRGVWGRRGGKNVRVYEVTTERIEVDLGVEGLGLVLHHGERRAPPPPLYIPPRLEKNPNFVGRVKELELLSSRLNFIVLEGMAGIGKTTLLQSFAETLPRGSLFWHTFKETDSFDHLVLKLAVFLRELNFSELLDYISWSGKDDSAKIDLLTRGLNRNRLVLIFDDYQLQHDERIDSLLHHLQRNLSRGKAIVASRARPNFLIAGSNSVETQLEGLSLKESAQLLRRRKINLTSEQLALVHKKTSGHPLALSVLVTIGATGPNMPRNMTPWFPSKGLMDELLRSLSEDERNLLITLSAFRNPIPYEGIVQVVKLRGIRYLLHSLQRKLILEQNNETYNLHEMIREGCEGLLDHPEYVHRKVGEWYLKSSSTQDVLEGLYHLSKANEWVGVGEVLSQELYEERFRFVEEGFSIPLLGILQRADPKKLPVPLACCMLCVQARAFLATQDWGKAKTALGKAKTMAEQLKDPKLIGFVLKTIGRNEADKGNLRKAERNFLDGSVLLRQAGDAPAVERLSLELARLYFAEGNVGRAMQFVSRNKTLT